jgi:hypothetical protein
MPHAACMNVIPQTKNPSLSKNTGHADSMPDAFESRFLLLMETFRFFASTHICNAMSIMIHKQAATADCWYKYGNQKARTSSYAQISRQCIHDRLDICFADLASTLCRMSRAPCTVDLFRVVLHPAFMLYDSVICVLVNVCT